MPARRITRRLIGAFALLVMTGCTSTVLDQWRDDNAPAQRPDALVIIALTRDSSANALIEDGIAAGLPAGQHGIAAHELPPIRRDKASLRTDFATKDAALLVRSIELDGSSRFLTLREQLSSASGLSPYLSDFWRYLPYALSMQNNATETSNTRHLIEVRLFHLPDGKLISARIEERLQAESLLLPVRAALRLINAEYPAARP